MSIVRIAGRVRGMFAGNYPENREDEEFHINNRGDQCVALALPERAELVRLGKSYVTIGTTVAPVAALPTTAAHLTLWNGENDDGLSYVIDTVGTIITTSAGAAINLGLCYELAAGKQTNPAGAIAIKSLSGRVNYTGKGNVKASVSITSDQWYPVGNSLIIANTANICTGVEYPVYGRLIVPPGSSFSLVSLCNVANSASCQPWIIWHEVRLILG